MFHAGFHLSSQNQQGLVVCKVSCHMLHLLSSYATMTSNIYRRQNGQEGFVPANYVQEIEPLKVKEAVKQKQVEMVPVKIKKKKIEKRSVSRGRFGNRKATNRGSTRGASKFIL